MTGGPHLSVAAGGGGWNDCAGPVARPRAKLGYGLPWSECELGRGDEGVAAEFRRRPVPEKVGWAELMASDRGGEVEGAAADFYDLGSNKNMSERVEGREKKEKKGFSDFEKQQTIEFKCKFEFKHFKIMHQHVCNIKLLGLICFILVNIKCLKEIKENLIVLKNKFKVANKFLKNSSF
jgi:hypothetical protein